MGTRIIIPNADFSRNGLPLEKNIVFLLGAGETARVLMGCQDTAYQPEIAPEGTVEEIAYNQDVVSRYYGYNIPNGITTLSSVLSVASDAATIINTGIKEIIFNNLLDTMLTRICMRCYGPESVSVKNTTITSIEGNFTAFAGSSRIKGTIDLSGITYRNQVQKCESMFYGASRTKQIYIPNMYRINNSSLMFSTCSLLEFIDMSNCSFESYTYVAAKHVNMFSNCPKLNTIKVVGCTSEFKTFIIARLSDAGYTFVETVDAEGNAVLVKQS